MQDQNQKYEILSLIEGKDWKYRVRAAYSGSIGAQLRAMITSAAREDMASQMTVKDAESHISDEDAWDYAFSKLCYLEETEEGKIWKFRNYLYPPFILPIVKVLVKPVGDAPPLDIDEMSVEAINTIHFFFTVCSQPPSQTSEETEKSGESSESNGAEEKQSSTRPKAKRTSRKQSTATSPQNTSG